ncbi:hypothetical protein ILUMI_18168 [Ignelater luminosus]|uniref:Uncharacterized protein n=1 Tax=Ignelater luminosus TaxID=2038154 RepID=A0A8K0CIT6_IGNLU|nr:hypothetical protein ILUMI_18168 [Ignelater luminosus]
MMVLKTKGSLLIFVFLMVLLFAISECKRGGGGGRIFRTTILKGRRNSRRSRDLYAQQMSKSQWSDPLSVSNKMIDESLEAHNTPVPNDIEKSLFYVYPYGFIEQKKEYQNSAEDMTIQQQQFASWNSEHNFKSPERENRNLERDDENLNTQRKLSSKHTYSSQGYLSHTYPKSYDNDQNQQYAGDQLMSEYNHAIPNPHYEPVDRGNYMTDPYYSEANGADTLFNDLLGKNTNKDLNGIEGYKQHFDFEKDEEKIKFYTFEQYSQYYIYNYYDNSRKIPKETSLSEETLVLCRKDFTSFCVPNTVPVCISNGEVLCIAPKQYIAPCTENFDLKCLSTEITVCTDENRESCKDNEEMRTYAAVNIPCLTNTTIRAESRSNGGETTFCVVTLLIPKNKKEPDEATTLLFT